MANFQLPPCLSFVVRGRSLVSFLTRPSVRYYVIYTIIILALSGYSILTKSYSEHLARTRHSLGMYHTRVLRELTLTNTSDTGNTSFNFMSSVDQQLAQVNRTRRNVLPNYYLGPGGEAYQRAKLTFVHYPKGGGTTIKDCFINISDSRGQSTPPTVFAGNAAEVKGTLLNGGMQDVPVFMGTYAFGICDYLTSEECAYFTILRDPIDRMVSHYFFCKYGGESNAPCDLPIEDFAVLVTNVFFHQLTFTHNCRRESGAVPGDGKWTCDQKAVGIEPLVEYDEVKIGRIMDDVEAQLDKNFAVIGILEELETSLLLLQETFGVPFYEQCRGAHSNGNRKESEERLRERKLAKETLMKSERAQLAMAADIRLYKRAKEIFEQQKGKSQLLRTMNVSR